MTKPEPLRLAYWRRGSTSVTVPGSLTSSPSDIELHISIRAGIRGSGRPERRPSRLCATRREQRQDERTSVRRRNAMSVEKVCVVVVYYSRMSHCSGPTDRHRLLRRRPRRRPHRACRRRRICRRPSSSHSRGIEPRPSSSRSLAILGLPFPSNRALLRGRRRAARTRCALKGSDRGSRACVPKKGKHCPRLGPVIAAITGKRERFTVKFS